MSEKYVISGIGEPFDGLIVHATKFGEPWAGLAAIERIEKSTDLFQNFSIPIGSGLYIETGYLEPFKEKDFATDNPMGELISNNMFTRNGITLTQARYDRCIAVDVLSAGKTVFSHIFYIDRTQFFDIEDLIYEFATDENFDPENIVFRLKDLIDV